PSAGLSLHSTRRPLASASVDLQASARELNQGNPGTKMEATMPLVFVHGVSNRDTPEYSDNQLARDAFLRELVIPALGLAAENFRIFNPYWGDQGVKFRWGNASLPESASEIETFGALDPEDLRMAADVLAAASPDALDIVAVAQRSL